MMLDGMCKRCVESGLAAPAILHQAAEMASAEPRGKRKSFRDALEERAARI